MKTYGELKAAIANWLDREDLTAEIPDFIRLAETKIYRSLRIRETEFQHVYTPADDPFNPIELPQNFKEVKLVTVNDQVLERISDQEFYVRERDWNRDLYPDEVRFFAVINRKLHIHPWPKTTKTVEEWGDTQITLDYYGTESIGEMATWDTPTNPNQVPEQSGTTPTTSQRGDDATTRLLQVAPDAYLFGACTEAYIYLREPQKVMEFQALFSGALQTLNAESIEAEYAGSTVSVSNSYGGETATRYYGR